MEKPKTRQKFSPAQKISFLKKHLVEGIPVSDICDKYSIHPNLFYRWQKQLFENAEIVFQPSNKPKNAKYEQKIAGLEAKIRNKNEVLSELMEEYVSVKKNLGEI